MYSPPAAPTPGGAGPPGKAPIPEGTGPAPIPEGTGPRTVSYPVVGARQPAAPTSSFQGGRVRGRKEGSPASPPSGALSPKMARTHFVSKSLFSRIFEIRHAWRSDPPPQGRHPERGGGGTSCRAFHTHGGPWPSSRKGPGPTQPPLSRGGGNCHLHNATRSSVRQLPPTAHTHPPNHDGQRPPALSFCRRWIGLGMTSPHMRPGGNHTSARGPTLPKETGPPGKAPITRRERGQPQ